MDNITILFVDNELSTLSTLVANCHQDSELTQKLQTIILEQQQEINALKSSLQ